MENGHKWSWKVLGNAHEKVLESHGKPLSVSVRTLDLDIVSSPDQEYKQVIGRRGIRKT